MSRSTTTLEDAIIHKTLPYAEEVNQGSILLWFWGSEYGLRIGGGFRQRVAVSAPVTVKPPLVLVPFISDFELPSGSVKEQDVEGLMSWLEREGVEQYMEGAHLETLNTDLHLLKAADQLRGYATILSGMPDEQVERLVETLLYIVDPPIPIDSSIDWFHKRLQAIMSSDESLYAIIGVEWIDALVGYAGILNTEFHWPIDKCIEKAMRDYIIRLKTDDHRFFVREYLRRSLVADSNDENVITDLIWSPRRSKKVYFPDR